MTLQPLKQKANEPVERLHDPLKLGVPQLIDLWYEMRDFDHEAYHIFVDCFSRSKWALKWVPLEQSSEA